MNYVGELSKYSDTDNNCKILSSGRYNILFLTIASHTTSPSFRETFMGEHDERHTEGHLHADPVDAARDLFERYHAGVFNVCIRLLGNREEAEDIAQDVFIRAFKAYAHFRGDADPGTWLYRIAVNLCLNHQRKQKQWRWLSLDFFSEHPQTYPLAGRDMHPEEAVQKAELERIVQDAINRLPGRQRIALILSRYEGLSYQKIAETMACSVSSVESLLHRAKHNLAKRLRPYINEL